MQKMTPNQPYLLRAFFDWIIDNDLTPYMVIDANYPDVQIPTQFVNNGQIVLNVSPSACVNFSMDLDWVQFQARFSGQPMLVSFPCVAVGAIYAKENGAGTVFTVPEPPQIESEQPETKKAPTLKAAPDNSQSSKRESTAADTKSKETSTSKDHNDDKPKKKKPGLRIVK